MNELMVAIALWLTANFGLPAIPTNPKVEFVTSAKIVALRHSGSDEHKTQSVALQPGQRETLSIYNNDTKTIYLRSDWTGRTPADLSILVHEMVHHIQNLAQLKYSCVEEREKMAYHAQKKWLELFGRDLESEFEIDGFTLLVITNCPR